MEELWFLWQWLCDLCVACTIFCVKIRGLLKMMVHSYWNGTAWEDLADSRILKIKMLNNKPAWTIPLLPETANTAFCWKNIAISQKSYLIAIWLIIKSKMVRSEKNNKKSKGGGYFLNIYNFSSLCLQKYGRNTFI